MLKSGTALLILATFAALSIAGAAGSAPRETQQGSTLQRRAIIPALARDAGVGPTTSFSVYFFLQSQEAGGPFLVPVHREVPETVGVARAALEALITGPTEEEAGASVALSSSVPQGSQLLGVSVAEGIARVDLSEDFESGGGSFSVRGRLAQLVFTLTQFPTVDAVILLLRGEVVTVFSAEGVVIDAPLTRDDFADFLPAILVEHPAYGAPAGNPMRVSGTANVFEASFLIQLLDGDGRLLIETPVMATCGTGCRGTFDVTIPYVVVSEQPGTLTAWVASARDGSPLNVRTYPVTLRPTE